ncbi:MAG: hypothetical protein JWM80_4543 [Cyanobacteria bacterium RYN_339]|nr:hypothetical protein [Cyanobacteria bacterium RYN_339]
MTVVNAQIAPVAFQPRVAAPVTGTTLPVNVAPRTDDRCQLQGAAAPKADPLAGYAARTGINAADFLAAGWQDKTPLQLEIADTKAKLKEAKVDMVWPGMVTLDAHLKALEAREAFQNGGADSAELLWQMDDMDKAIQACDPGDMDKIINLHESMQIRDTQLRQFGKPHSPEQKAHLEKLSNLEHELWAAKTSMERGSVQQRIQVEQAILGQLERPVTPAQRQLMDQMTALGEQTTKAMDSRGATQLQLALQTCTCRLQASNLPHSQARTALLAAMEATAREVGTASSAAAIQQGIIKFQSLQDSFEQTL